MLFVFFLHTNSYDFILFYFILSIPLLQVKVFFVVVVVFPFSFSYFSFLKIHFMHVY